MYIIRHTSESMNASKLKCANKPSPPSFDATDIMCFVVGPPFENEGKKCTCTFNSALFLRYINIQCVSQVYFRFLGIKKKGVIKCFV